MSRHHTTKIPSNEETKELFIPEAISEVIPRGKISVCNILLLPHADKKYTSRAMIAAAKRVPKNKFTSVYVISTAHDSSDSFDLSTEHSYKWMKDALKDTHIYPLLDDNNVDYATSKMVSKIYSKVKTLLATQPECLIIFNTDLTHYGKAYPDEDGKTSHYGPANVVFDRLKYVWEKPLLTALESSPQHVSKAIEDMPYWPCGSTALLILARVLLKFGYIGSVIDYYDSMEFVYKDVVFEDESSYPAKDADASFVSYVAMSFGPKSYTSDFAEDWISRWTEYTKEKNNVFVQLESIIDGQSRACVGITDDSNVEDKVRKLCKNSLLPDLESGRLSTSKHDSFPLSELYGCVTVLSTNWKRILHSDYTIALPKINSQDSNGQWHGVKCTFSSGNTDNDNAIYIPSVWKERPDWTIFDILKSLSKKAGLGSNAWRESLYIEIFTQVGTFT